MDVVYNDIGECAKLFFHHMSIYMDTTVYYYGSVLRIDYIKGKSDIDVEIFVEDEKSAVAKLQSFLKLKRYEFRPFVYNMSISQKVVKGIKVKFIDSCKHFETEISIYNSKHKDTILYEQQKKANLSLIVIFFLYLLKMLYYSFGIINEDLFKTMKKHLLGDGGDFNFMITDVDPEHKREKEKQMQKQKQKKKKND
jgi:hypothetical protein